MRKGTSELEDKSCALEESRLAPLNIPEDVSDTKDKLDQSYEDLRKLDSLKDDFINIGAHELKTPLIPIIGYLSMVLKDPTLSEVNRKRLEIAFRAAKREENLVKDVLDISKLESENMKFDMDEVDLGDIVEKSVQEMQSLVRDRGLVLEARRQENMPKIQGDSQRLSPVVTNLIGNVAKFTDKGSITVEAGRHNGSVYVSVKDTGIGMPAEALPKLFIKFYQVDSGLSRNHDGSGLGLAICKKIVEAHGGRIWVESVPGQGSTFSFSIPI